MIVDSAAQAEGNDVEELHAFIGGVEWDDAAVPRSKAERILEISRSST